MFLVWVPTPCCSLSPPTGTTQRRRARQSTRRTVSTSGRGQGTTRGGHPYKEHARTILTTRVKMFRRKDSSKFHTMTARMYPNRCAMMSPPRSAELLRNRSVLKFLIKTAGMFHSSNASQFIRKYPRESAEGYQSKCVMTELAMVAQV